MISRSGFAAGRATPAAWARAGGPLRAVALFLYLAVLLVAAPAPARELDPSVIVDPPWHLADIWWETGRSEPFQRLSIDITLDADVDSAVRLYIAGFGLGRLNGVKFYAGLQTQLQGRPLTGGRILPIGRGAIFSRWDEDSPAALRPAPDGVVEIGGYEGRFVSVRAPLAWRAGRYTLKLERLPGEPADDPAYSWVGLSIRGHASGEERFVGALRFPGSELRLDGKLAAFVEIYGPRIPVAAIPQLRISFSALTLNGAPIAARKISARYPRNIPDLARVSRAADAVHIDLGQPVLRRQRSEELR